MIFKIMVIRGGESSCKKRIKNIESVNLHIPTHIKILNKKNFLKLIFKYNKSININLIIKIFFLKKKFFSIYYLSFILKML